ncbi:OmpW family outer membrane protein [Alteromonas sp. CYL-A6]|uniref:OmpW family outer membrane protein n=1 Tax=Alteromonas nitratireducens TaxID=3390813 RepID=UPI0034AF01CC
MKKSLLAIALTAAIVTPSVMAHQQGDIVVRVGATMVSPDDSSGNIFAGDADLGVGLKVDSNTQLGLNVAYFLTDNINVELLAATPFTHDVDFSVTDPLGTGTRLGEVTHLPPTVTVNYYFNDSASAFQPYVGAGLNYTIFFDEEFTRANRETGLGDLSLDNSFGLAAQVGMDYMLDKQWHINASVRWIDIDTDATFSVGDARGTVGDIQIDPWVYTISVGYTF